MTVFKIIFAVLICVPLACLARLMFITLREMAKK